MARVDIKVKVRGVEQLTRLAHDLEDAPPKFKRKLLRNIRKATAHLPDKVRASILAELPKRGGLAALIADDRIAQRTNLRGGRIGVYINMNDREHDISDLNRGSLRHPLYGNRAHWYDQAVRPDWFNKPLEDSEQEVFDAIKAAVDEMVTELGR